jgi:hypothetical protein
MKYSDRQAIRYWREIADELISEPNTGRILCIQLACGFSPLKVDIKHLRGAAGSRVL